MKDEQWLESQFSFPLMATNMEGVYTTPPLPDDFDLKSASDATLLRHGLLLRRPRPGDSPASVAAWNELCERGLRTMAPHLAPLPETRRRMMSRRGPPGPRSGGPPPPGGGSGGGQVTLSNLCGGALEGTGDWQSVTGTVRLPYLRVPSQGLQANQTAAGLNAWVGLGGLGILNSDFYLLQACVGFSLNTQTTPPSTDVAVPNWLWLVPNSEYPDSAAQVFAGATIANPPLGEHSGTRIRLHCAYVAAKDGSIWGAASFLFYYDFPSCPEPAILPRRLPQPIGPAVPPTLVSVFVPGPTGFSGSAKSIDWILENMAVTSGIADAVVPEFTPITFTNALGSGQSGAVAGDPIDGFTILWTNNSGASVALASQTVSITYTGP